MSLGIRAKISRWVQRALGRGLDGRGVGEHLKEQHKLFGKLDFSGARIEHIGEKLECIGDRPESHVMVMVGTNNLQVDRTEVMVEKYEKLVSDLKARDYKSVSMVSLVKWRDVRFDRQVMLTNCRNCATEKV